MNNTLPAIIIPTANRADQLRSCLQSIENHILHATSIRVIVIDNNTNKKSSARTESICRGFSWAHYASCAKPGLTAARHHSLELTDSQVLCFVDDDVLFTPDWLNSIRQTFEDQSVSLAGGPTIPSFSQSIPSWLWDFLQSTPYGGWCCPWLSLLDIGTDVNNINPNWIWGLNFAIRREVLLDCGGFHIDLVPKQYMRWQGDGETGLTMKLAAKGYKAVYRQDSLLFHDCGPDRLNPEYFAKRAYYQGVCNSYAELRRKLRGEEPAQDPAPRANLLKRALRRSVNSIKNRLLFRTEIQAPQAPWAAAAADVRALCQKAEQEGYLFHQREAAADPALREWICRDNYFDVDLRDLIQP